MTASDFTYGFHSEEASAAFFSLMERAGVQQERIQAMKQTREAFLATAAAISRAAAKAVQASQARDDLIRQAHAEGSTIRAIAGACGLSPSRIHQILHRR